MNLQLCGFEQLLQRNIVKLQAEIRTEKYGEILLLLQETDLNACLHESDVRWNFVIWNLKLLSVLKMCIEKVMQDYNHKVEEKKTPTSGTKPEMSPDTFSFTQQKIITTSVQFVLTFGMCPAFLPGVGVPLEKRSEFGNLINNSSEGQISLAERMRRLLTCLKVNGLKKFRKKRNFKLQKKLKFVEK